jgi:hypothetical protein
VGFFLPILDESEKLTCSVCGQAFRSGVSRSEGGRKMGYLCHTCGENDPYPLPVSVRVNAWPVFAICLTAIGTITVVLILNELVGTALRLIVLSAPI